ncbi:hypothetical protein RchiOBHm_Chr3g0489151 [Rosa chinensis]|uniref:Uncharacterized protein n=1 Tax=Rosa chinensis TaxID=74649 RepID=A0A2P6RFX8_ROSCH|nr:hypothetical protein RchiOBHm_Chr3g0489151 [Rosa chinensis]
MCSYFYFPTGSCSLASLFGRLDFIVNQNFPLHLRSFFLPVFYCMSLFRVLCMWLVEFPTSNWPAQVDGVIGCWFQGRVQSHGLCQW